MTETKYRCRNNAPRSFDINFKLDPPRITFRPCNNYSEYPIDIETKYCKVCQTFIQDEVYDASIDPELREE